MTLSPRNLAGSSRHRRGIPVACAGPAAMAMAAALLLPPPTLQAQQGDGEQTFQSMCAMCHTVGGGRLVGPDLQGLADRRSEQWIIDFVQHSQDLVQAGDSTATALFDEFGGMVMPDQPLDADQVRSILSYISSLGSAGAAAEQPGTATTAPATDEQITLGQELFQGTTRLTNGGPTCNSCHEVTHDAVIGGGVLARELTTVFSRLGGPGVRAILGSPPFPVMQQAYEGKPLTEAEVASLVAFLQQADTEQALHQPRDYGIKLFGSGLVGALVLLGLYSVAWGGRKRGSVNQEIFDRQVRST